MPTRERFRKPVNVYAVALHELTHWTGHESRLAREFSGRFGDEAYAFEELVAELGSAFLVARLGLKGTRLENHANYVQSWLKVLRNDKSAIFTVSRSASAAYQFILQKVGVAEMTDTVEVVEALSACEGMCSKGRAGLRVLSPLTGLRAALGAAAPPRGIPVGPVGSEPTDPQ